MTPIYYLIELPVRKGPKKDRFVWFNTVHEASLYGSARTVAPTNRSYALPDGEQGKDYLITYSNYL